MADQIIVFKNGERVITNLQEVFEGEDESRRGVCLLMNNPYILELVGGDDPTAKGMDLQVKFSKWCPYSVDFQFRVPYDTVLALGEPDSGLAEAYRQKVAAITGNPDAPEGVPDLPEWTDGAENPNISAQQADIDAVVNGFEGNGAPVDESVGS